MSARVAFARGVLIAVFVSVVFFAPLMAHAEFEVTTTGQEVNGGLLFRHDCVFDGESVGSLSYLVVDGYHVEIQLAKQDPGFRGMGLNRLQYDAMLDLVKPTTVTTSYAFDNARALSSCRDNFRLFESVGMFRHADSNNVAAYSTAGGRLLQRAGYGVCASDRYGKYVYKKGALDRADVAASRFMAAVQERGEDGTYILNQRGREILNAKLEKSRIALEPVGKLRPALNTVADGPIGPGAFLGDGVGDIADCVWDNRRLLPGLWVWAKVQASSASVFMAEAAPFAIPLAVVGAEIYATATQSAEETAQNKYGMSMKELTDACLQGRDNGGWGRPTKPFEPRKLWPGEEYLMYGGIF